jgi:TRAP-type C4-dicarboxylate transport system permease small subunit
MSDSGVEVHTPGRGAQPAPLRPLRSLVTHPVEWACGLLMTGITVLVFLQVITRYVLEYPLDWPEEVARILFVWVALLGAVLALRRGSHFSIGMFTQRLSAPARRRLDILLRAALLAFIVLVAWLGLDAAMRVRYQESAAMEISMSWAYASVPVGFGLMAVEMARGLWRDLRGRR